jgi:hypothetical protein
MRNQIIPSGNVVKEFTLGSVQVRICDDYCRDRTKAETDAILARIAANAIGPLNAAAQKNGDAG